MAIRCEHAAGGSGHAAAGMLTWHAELRPVRYKGAGVSVWPRGASRVTSRGGVLRVRGEAGRRCAGSGRRRVYQADRR